MSLYAGLDEQGLRKLLDTSSDITERRQIRAALRELRANNNNNIAHPHYRTPISSAKLAHHQSFRYERRRRPETDDAGKKHSQDDDILYRSRRKREMERGGGEDGDDENEEVEDIDVRIREIGSDEQKLTKLLSETRDFGDRRKVRSAIREARKKNRQDESEAQARNQQQPAKDDQQSSSPSVSVQRENRTNLALSRSSTQEGQRSNAPSQETPGDSDQAPARSSEQQVPRSNTSSQQQAPGETSSSRSSSRLGQRSTEPTKEASVDSNQIPSRSSANEGQRSTEPTKEVPADSNQIPSRSSFNRGQRSTEPCQADTEETDTRVADVDEQIKTLQKQLETAKSYEERRGIRAEIRELRQKKNGFDGGFTRSQPQQRGAAAVEHGPLQKKYGREHDQRSGVNSTSNSAGAKRTKSDIANQMRESLVSEENWDDEDEEEVEGSGEECPYALLDPVNTKGGPYETQEKDISPHAEDPDSGYVESHLYDVVAGAESTNKSFETDISVEMPDLPANEVDNQPINGSVDTMGYKNEQGSNAGCYNSTSSTNAGSGENEYEIIPPLEFRNSFLSSQSHDSDSGISTPNDTGQGEHCMPMPVVKVSPTVPVTVKSPVNQGEENMRRTWTEEKKEWENNDGVRNLLPSEIKKRQRGANWIKEDNFKKGKENEKRSAEEETVVHNVLPSEIKKKQNKSSGLQTNRPEIAKVKQSPTSKSNPKVPHYNPPANPALEVVKRPEGSRRARIIRSFLELERIKKEGPGALEGRSIQINAPNALLSGNGMKAVSGAGGNLRGSDQMLEDMINLQLMQAMGVDPHSLAASTGTPPKSAPAPSHAPVRSHAASPPRPSKLDLPSPIRTTKPQKPSNGPSKGIAQMMNRFGGGSQSPSPKQAVHSGFSSPAKPSSKPSTYASNGVTSPFSNGQPASHSKTQTAQFSRGQSPKGLSPKGQSPRGQSASPFPKGLKKTAGKTAFNIDINGDDVEISLDGNQQFLMNKLAPSSSRAKGK